MKFVLDDKILLGGGKFAQIFHATRGTEPVAAKKHNNVDVLLKEADFLKLCDHPNVLRYIDLMEFGNMTYLITEFAREGNLQGKLGLRKFAPNQKISLVRQLCRGLVYLHSKNILHRNIAPGNILFKNSESIVISDFSKAVDFVEGIQVDHNEPLPEKEYTLKSDVFLLALVVFQIFEDRRTVNRKTLADEIQEKAFSPEGLCREIFEKKIWIVTILNSLFWKANKRPKAIDFHNAFKD